MIWITRVLWLAFLSSVAVAGHLVLSDLHSERAGRQSGLSRSETNGPGGPASAPSAALSARRGSVATQDESGEEVGATDGHEGKASADDGGSSPGDASGEDVAGEDAAGEGPGADPEAFLASLLDLVRAGDIDGLTAKMRPGALRALREPLFALLLGEDARKQLDAALSDLQFRFEETPDGNLRLLLSGSPRAEIGPELFLVPKDGSWELASSSDLAGAAADSERATKRLELLALCQSTYRMEDLGGGGQGYAGTAHELSLGLDRSAAYRGVLDPEFVRAADTGRPFEGYVFGRIPTGASEFGYYAIPADYGPGPRETLLIDSRGRVWAKDLLGGPPPTEWPGQDSKASADPAKEGWRKVEGPSF